MVMRTVAVGVLAASVVGANLTAQNQTRYQVLFNRFQVPVMTLQIADADGKRERALLATPDLDYSPSFSADGRWLVFTTERDGQAEIYRVHPDGSGLERLTEHPAFDDQAALSPDGKTLAFVSTRDGGTANIWTVDLASKKATNLTANRSGNFRPSWSPDGAWIAFTSDRDAQPGVWPGMWEHLQSTGVYVMRARGGDLRRLTRKDGFSGSPTWSADGRRILFYETDELGAYLSKGGNSRTEIVSVDVTTGERKFYTASNETKLSPRWLSQGRISYIKRGSDATSGLRVWHPDRRVETVIAGAVRNATWSPDGNSVAFERITKLGSTEHLIPASSPDTQFDLLMSEPFPAFSPDGSKLLYSQYGRTKSVATGVESASAGNTSVEIMSDRGSDKRTLFQREGFSAYSAVWSPSGDEIALSVGRYFRAPGLPSAQIALIKPDGSNFRLIVDDTLNNGFPSWSRDGSRLVFKRGKQLVTMSLADRTITPLTDGAHYDNFPQWSPTRDLIMFTTDRDGDFELYTIRHDGTDRRRLTNMKGNDAHSSWCSDGNWIVFSSARHGFKDEMALYDGVPQPYGEIFAMRADGSDVRQLTDNKWEDASAACRVTPQAAPPRSTRIQ
jgi:TolB protein